MKRSASGGEFGWWQTFAAQSRAPSPLARVQGDLPEATRSAILGRSGWQPSENGQRLARLQSPIDVCRWPLIVQRRADQGVSLDQACALRWLRHSRQDASMVSLTEADAEHRSLPSSRQSNATSSSANQAFPETGGAVALVFPPSRLSNRGCAHQRSRLPVTAECGDPMRNSTPSRHSRNRPCRKQAGAILLAAECGALARPTNTAWWDSLPNPDDPTGVPGHMEIAFPHIIALSCPSSVEECCAFPASSVWSQIIVNWC
jgi:hypothetical protein